MHKKTRPALRIAMNDGFRSQLMRECGEKRGLRCHENGKKRKWGNINPMMKRRRGTVMTGTIEAKKGKGEER